VTDEEVARLEEARRAVRVVERYMYWALGRADEGSEEARKVADQMRLVVGLRRKLDARLAGTDGIHPAGQGGSDVCKAGN
jgi:hypothetical protein